MKFNEYIEQIKSSEISDDCKNRILDAASRPDKEVLTMKNNNNTNENIVDEPVEVIRKTPIYRRASIVAAASLVLIAGGAGIGLSKLGKSVKNTANNEAAATTTASELPSDDASIISATKHPEQTEIEYEVFEAYECQYSAKPNTNIIRSLEALKLFELPPQKTIPEGTELSFKAQCSLDEEFFEEKALIFFIKEYGTTTPNMPDIFSVTRSGKDIWVNANREIADDEGLQTWCGFIIVNKSDIEGAENVKVNTAYPLYSGEVTDSKDIEFPIIEASESDMSNVIFDSEFPYIIYADENVCYFSDGASYLFVYDLQKHELRCAANIRKSILEARKSDPEIPEPQNIHIDQCSLSEDHMDIVATVTTPDHKNAYFWINDPEGKGSLKYLENVSEENILSLPKYDDPDEKEELFGDAIKLGDEGYICLANNHTLDSDTSEASQLNMIDIVLHKDKNGSVERFRPFELNTSQPTENENEPYDMGYDGFGIKFPSEFEPYYGDDPSVLPTHYDTTLEGGEKISFEFYLYPMYTADTGKTDMTPEDVVELMQNTMFSDAKIEKEDIKYWSFENEVSEKRTVSGCDFIYQKGIMLDSHPLKDTVAVYYEAFYGFVPCNMPDMNVTHAPIKWIAYTTSDSDEALNYIHKVVTDAADSAHK